MEQNLDTSLVKKNRRWGEWLIERGVATIASLSIILIFIIFIFVFRESLPLFSAITLSEPKAETPAKVEEPAQTSSEADADLRPEIYNPEVYNLTPAAAGEVAPEGYDPGASGSSESGADSYDPSASGSGESGVESYDPNAPASGSASGSSESGADSYDPSASGSGESGAESYDPNAPTEPGSSDNKATESAPAEETPIVEEHEVITPGNLAGTSWQPVSEKPRYGISTLLIGTAKTTIVAILFGAPLGILAALYSAFFAKKWLREIIKPVIELLAGFPSVVVGFFCLMVIGSITQTLFGLDFRLNAFVGGIGLGIAVIPIVFTLTEDALSSVPRALREASLAVGATEWETAYKVMLPAAFPGVFAAILLGIGRAFGETMIALMATGNAALFSFDVFDPARTFAATIGAEMGEVVWGSVHYNVLFFLGVILFVFAFSLNTITELFIKERLIKKFHGN